LSGPVSRGGFERQQQLVARMLRPAGAAVSFRQVEVRRRRIDGLSRKHGPVLANGAIVVVLCEPEITQPVVQILVNGVDVIQPVKRRGSVSGASCFNQQRGELLQRFRTAPPDFRVMLELVDCRFRFFHLEIGVGPILL